METTNPHTDPLPALREDRQMLMLMHLSQLLNLVTAVGGVIVPIVLWQLKKDEIQDMNQQGKEIANFQISLVIYYTVSLILTVVLIGIMGLIVAATINIIFPIIYGIQAKDGIKNIKYPLTIRFIQ